MSWIRDCRNQLVNLDDVRKICIEEIDEETEAFQAGSTHMVSAYSKSTADDDQPDYVFWLGNGISAQSYLEQIWGHLPKVAL